MVTRRIVLVLCCSFLSCGTSQDQTTVTGKCETGYHRCRDNSRIPNTWLCDKQNDCEDKSDENNCSLKTRSPDLEFPCGINNTASTPLRIDGSKVCDGTSDCSDGSDEKDCAPRCLSSEFACPDGVGCIPMTWVCDGENECLDGGDERPALCTAGVCGPQEFRCRDKGCIANSLRCNGLVDCPDGSDEEDCDIEKRDSPVLCSQTCDKVNGTSGCDCGDAEPDNNRRGNVSLILTNRLNILKISMANQERTVIFRGATFASGLDFIHHTGVIFWSDIAENKIYKTSIKEGNSRTEAISENIEFAYGLAVDWIYNHIYWTERGGNNPSVWVATLDGSITKSLIVEGLDKPSAIVVNPLEGWMFWSDLGEVAKIERAGLDGTHRQTIVSSDVAWPSGLTLDFVQRRIYWADPMLHVISSSDYDGSERRQILQGTEALANPYSVSVFEDHLYWTDINKPTIYQANKFNGSDVTIMALLKNRMYLQARPTLKVYHPYTQPEGVNHCGPRNGHCSHLCLPAPQVNRNSPKITCACPDGLFLMSGGLTCDDSLIYATCH